VYIDECIGWYYSCDVWMPC